MNYFRQFRRFLLLLLGVTLSVQSMAVASFGACHKTRTLDAGRVPIAAAHNSHGDPTAGHDDHGKHVAANAHSGDSEDRPVQDGSRVKCAACAACHLCGAVLTAEPVVADIPTAGSTSFPDSVVPRVRNVANGLERPPRA